jgi:hypothetical protein
MLKAQAWPYPIFQGLECAPPTASCDGIELKVRAASKGLVIAGGSLKERSSGKINLTVEIKTPASKVSETVFNQSDATNVNCGVRVLCKESKFRCFTVTNKKQSATLELPLEMLRGVAEITPMFVCANPATASNGIEIQQGAVLGIPTEAIFLAIDEDWTGETIPVDWLDFEKKKLPTEGFMHIEFSGGSQTPQVWLNSKYKLQIEHVLLRKGDASPAGLAGAAMRDFFWVQVWEKVLIWALKEESAENENWPATRIANHWRDQFAEHGWELTSLEEFDAPTLNELTLRIQHCLNTAQKLSRVQGILRFQPDVATAL